jgi:hypothetical protein
LVKNAGSCAKSRKGVREQPLIRLRGRFRAGGNAGNAIAQYRGGVAMTWRILVWGVASISLAAQTPPVPDDPVTRLMARIRSGEAKWEHQPGPRGYLRGLLKNLEVSVDSQVLVFSKTSFQAAKISPAAPRAIYFNDVVSVGSVQGSSVLELIALSPKDGFNFYTLEANPGAAPRFERRDAVCFSCHAPQNEGVPGMMVTSVYPDPDGMPFAGAQFFPRVDHRSPLEERWGGWYVTGTHGSVRHRGNAVAPDPHRPGDLETMGTQNLTDLKAKVDLASYLTGSSDIVALMALEHQTGVANLIVRLGQRTREGLRAGSIAGAGGKRIDALVEELVEYMLFAGEAPLREPVRGNSTFTQTFAALGPRDSKGRSLRDFDLQKRMFQYPLSYMVYSEAFDSLPNAALARVYRRLFQVLTGKNTGPKFAHLSAADRNAILEILRETKPNLPEDWKARATE